MYWHFPYWNRKVKNCKQKRLKTPKLEKLIGIWKYWYLHGWLWHGEHMNNNVMSLKILSMFDHKWVFCDGWFHPIHFEYGDNIKSSIQDYLSKWYFRLRIMLDMCSTDRCCNKCYLLLAFAGLTLTHLIGGMKHVNWLESGFLSFIYSFCGFVKYAGWWSSTICLSQIWLQVIDDINKKKGILLFVGDMLKLTI
jgi:hypothetical protein